MQYGSRLNRNHRNRNDQPNYGEALLPRLAAHGPEEAAALDLRAPRKINKSLDSGMISIMISCAFDALTVGQRGFWDEEQRATKLQDKKPVLRRLADSIPWESFRPLLGQGYAQER